MTVTSITLQSMSKSTSNWRVPALLLLLGILSIVNGALQLHAINQSPSDVPSEFTSAHYFEIPIPIVLHIVFGVIFNLLSPLQFAPLIRQRWPVWHRWSGGLLIASGGMTALCALWMNQFYPLFGGSLKYYGVVAHSVGLIASLGIALRAVLARDIARHRAWMMRAVAIALGPATQRLFVIPIFLFYGELNHLLIGLVVWFGLIVNLSVVEWILLRQRRSVRNSPSDLGDSRLSTRASVSPSPPTS